MFEIISLKNGLENVKGFYCSGTNVGLKQQDNDVAFIRSDINCEIEAIFTTNRFQAAPISIF